MTEIREPVTNQTFNQGAKMTTYPYDPETGKRLMRSGYSVNPIQPMTQKEVDQQCKLVSIVAESMENRPPTEDKTKSF